MGHCLHPGSPHPCLPKDLASVGPSSLNCLSQDMSPWKPLGKRASRQRRQTAAQWRPLEDGGGVHPTGPSARPQPLVGLSPQAPPGTQTCGRSRRARPQPQEQASLALGPLLSCLQCLKLGLQADVQGEQAAPPAAQVSAASGLPGPRWGWHPCPSG